MSIGKGSAKFIAQYGISKGMVLPPDKVMQYLAKPKLTMQDLLDCYADGYDAGHDSTKERIVNASASTMKICYAAALLTLHKEFGFGQERGLRFVRALDDTVTDTLLSDDAVNEVYEKMGITVKFHEGMDRVRKVEKK